MIKPLPKSFKALQGLKFSHSQSAAESCRWICGRGQQLYTKAHRKSNPLYCMKKAAEFRCPPNFTSMNEYDAFAEICKRYGLTKNEGTFRLCCAYDRVVAMVLMPHFDDNNALELASLINLLNDGSSIEIVSKRGGSVHIGEFVEAQLFMALNQTLINSYGRLYEELGIAERKGSIAPEGLYIKECYFSDENLLKPYTKQEISEILTYEKGLEEKKRRINCTYRSGRSPKLGYLAFLLDNVFSESREGLELNTTSKLNLIAELLEASGAITAIKGKVWYEKKWESVKDGGRGAVANEVRGWLKSYKRLVKKEGKAFSYSGAFDYGMSHYNNIFFSENQRSVRNIVFSRLEF